jgi:hypothetical protein
MIKTRIDRINQHRRSVNRNLLPGPNRKMTLKHPYRRATFPAQAAKAKEQPMLDDEIRTAYIAFQTKSLDDDPHVPRLVKWLLRRVYHRYGWTAMDHDGKSYSKWAFLGIFDTATGARWAAMVPGGSWMELPLNESLPEETSQFRVHDFPCSSVSVEYRNRKLPYVAIARQQLDELETKINQTADCAEGRCAKVV